MKKVIFFLCFILFFTFNCKTYFKNSNTGNFSIINYSDKEIEFIWITPKGDFYPTVKSINIKKNDSFELQNLKSGFYDIAIDFKGEYNTFNSKKDKNLCLYIEKGFMTIWQVDTSGKIIRN